MEFHEYANLFPMMSEAEITDLSQDIWKHGQEHPIIIHEGKILDGRNRWKACQLGLIEPKLKDYDGNDALAFVISCNLKRRQLTPSQTGMIAQEAAQLKRGAPSGNTNAEKTNGARAPFVSDPSESEAKTMSQLADQFDISRDTIKRARQVAESGAPELVQAVKDGSLPVKAAAQLSKLPIEQQREVLAEGVPAAKKAAAEVREHGAEAVAATRSAPAVDGPEPKPARITYVQKIGMEIAMKVTSQLDRITNPDKEFEPALRAVIAYCEKRLAQKTKK